MMRGIGAIEIGIILVVIPLAILLTVLPFWKICKKAGFPGAISLFMLIPIANIILPFYLAFAEWPVLKQKERKEEMPA